MSQSVVLQCVAGMFDMTRQCVGSVLQCVAVCCSSVAVVAVVLQCVAVVFDMPRQLHQLTLALLLA